MAKDPYVLFFRALKRCRNLPDVREDLENYLLNCVNNGEKFQSCTMLKIIGLLYDKNFSDFALKLLYSYALYYSKHVSLGNCFHEKSEVKLAKLVRRKESRKDVLNLLSMASILHEETVDVLIGFIDEQEVYDFLIKNTKKSWLLKKPNIERLWMMVHENSANSKKAANLLKVAENSENYMQSITCRDAIFNMKYGFGRSPV